MDTLLPQVWLQLSPTPCSVSEVVTSAEALEEHIEQSTMSVENITECLEQSEASLDAVEPIVHPCGKGEWRLVVDDKYSNPTADDCPNGWLEFSTAGRRFCARSSTDFDSPTCDSAFFAVSDGPYSRVCGKIVGYGHGANGGFAPDEINIGSVYVNGLSLTHGASTQREHIWTFAIGYVERAIMFYDVLSLPHAIYSECS